jgi:hypothetical protein
VNLTLIRQRNQPKPLDQAPLLYQMCRRSSFQIDSSSSSWATVRSSPQSQNAVLWRGPGSFHVVQYLAESGASPSESSRISCLANTPGGSHGAGPPRTARRLQFDTCAATPRSTLGGVSEQPVMSLIPSNSGQVVMLSRTTHPRRCDDNGEERVSQIHAGVQAPFPGHRRAGGPE